VDSADRPQNNENESRVYFMGMAAANRTAAARLAKEQGSARMKGSEPNKIADRTIAGAAVLHRIRLRSF